MIECVRETTTTRILPPPASAILNTAVGAAAAETSAPTKDGATAEDEGNDDATAEESDEKSSSSQTDGFVKQIVDYKIGQSRKTWGRLKEFFYIDIKEVDKCIAPVCKDDNLRRLCNFKKCNRYHCLKCHHLLLGFCFN